MHPILASVTDNVGLQWGAFALCAIGLGAVIPLVLSMFRKIGRASCRERV